MDINFKKGFMKTADLKGYMAQNKKRADSWNKKHPVLLGAGTAAGLGAGMYLGSKLLKR